MFKIISKTGALFAGMIAMALIMAPGHALAAIDGITGSTFNLTAKTGSISTPDGAAIFMWGYANEGGTMQFPGPTLIITEGTDVEIILTNELSVPTSIVFPGHQVSTVGGSAGLLTAEAPSGETVTYKFTADQPGTYTYYSGTRPELQIEMGLVGTIIVRPSMGDKYAYNHEDTIFDREYLEVLSDLDPVIHTMVETGNIDMIDNTDFNPVYWFINGRAFPDTIDQPNAPWLPTQPYNALVLMYPGEKVLLRVVGAGRDIHPQHTHGNNGLFIARDGRMLQSGPGAGPDLAQDINTLDSAPGQTIDFVFEWTGAKLGWDIYGTDNGHSCNGNGDDYDDTSYEYCPDHGKPFPVVLPELQNLTFGGAYSGSPYMGQTGSLPPGEAGLNEMGAFGFPWHSHSEKEIVNNDVFIGGMVTILFVLAR